MDFLYFLERLRNPVLDALMSAITFLGSEIAFMVTALIIFWCCNRHLGCYVLSVGFIGTLANQFLKLLFRVPRPWVLDPEFTIVESARADAAGYSFPSGHTQSSVGTFGGIARFAKRKWLRAVCITLAVLVPFSRMYLGVHTPKDVLVSAGIALLLIFIMYPLFRTLEQHPRRFWWLTVGMTAISAAFVLYVELFPFGSGMDGENLLHGTETAYTMLGCVLGLLLTLLLSKKRLSFEEKAPLAGQILKIVGGVLILFLLKEGLKPLMALIFGEHPVGRAVRYFSITLSAAWIWPKTFPFFARLGKKK